MALRIAFLMIGAAACWAVAGCTPLLVGLGAGAGVGTGVYAYVTGELKRSYQASFDQTLAASRSALQELGISVEVRQGSLTRTLRGRDGAGRTVTIQLHRLRAEVTEVAVRVGMIGIWDKDAAQSIHQTISHHLR